MNGFSNYIAPGALALMLTMFTTQSHALDAPNRLADDHPVTIREAMTKCGTVNSDAYCEGYWRGVVEAFAQTADVDLKDGEFVEKQANKLFCVPKNISPIIVARLVWLTYRKMVEAGVPNSTFEIPAPRFIAVVLKEEYPCSGAPL